MTKTTLTGLMVLFILMLGSCSNVPPIPTADECVPDIQIVAKYVPLDAWLTEPHGLPVVPSNGGNADLLEWAVSCAISNKMLNGQVKAIRVLDR